MEQKSKKKYFIAALAVLLVAVAVGGTIAWLTASDKVENSFTVGEITDPTTPPPGEEEPDPEDPNNDASLTGNIYEIFDEDEAKIIPGDGIMKRAWIGIGEGSESSFVFAYVDNQMMSQSADAADSTYFTLNNGWKPVSGAADNYNGDPTKFTGGLFMWVGQDNGDYPVALIGNENADVWTNEPVFNTVETPQTAVADDFAEKPVMNVHSFIIAETNEVNAVKAMDEARAWDTAGHQQIAGTPDETQQP